jgi:hypothetical protein
MSNFWGPFFSLFRGQKIFFNFFENTIASALKSCIITFLQKKEIKFFDPQKRAKILVEFECKYMKVGNRLLLAIL